MNWLERRRLLRDLMRTPAVNFQRGSTEWPEVLEEYFMIDDPILGPIRVICRNSNIKQARLEINREDVCGAARLYRRLKGVFEKDERYAPSEAELVPLEAWTAYEKDGGFEFRHRHIFYGEFHLHAKGVRLHFCALGREAVPAPRLYRKLVEYITELRQALMQAEWSQDPVYPTRYRCLLKHNHRTRRYIVEAHHGYGGSMALRLTHNDRIISNSEYDLWNQARRYVEQERQRLRREHKRSRKGKKKRN